MKIKVIKEHINYSPMGVYEVTQERGKYLIAMGVAEEVAEKVEFEPPKEKVEFTPQKEKVTRKRTKK